MGVPKPQVAERVSQVMQLISLENRAGDMAQSLSGGMQRMLNIGIGLVSAPDILLIDEPTAGIDQRARQQLHDVLNHLKDLGLAILLTTHDLDDAARLAQRVVVLVNGRLRAQGSVDELIYGRFAEQREVKLQLSGDESLRHHIEAELVRLGLSNAGDGLWRGLIDTAGNQLDTLYSEIQAHGHIIANFSLHKPGLDLFLQSLVDDPERVG